MAKSKPEDYDRIEMTYGKFGLMREQSTPEAAYRAFESYLNETDKGLLQDKAFRSWVRSTIEKNHEHFHNDYQKTLDETHVSWYNMDLDKNDREFFTKLRDNWRHDKQFNPTRANYDSFRKLSQTERSQFIKEGLAPDEMRVKAEIGDELNKYGMTPSKSWIDSFRSPSEVDELVTEAEWMAERRDEGKSVNLLNPRVESEFEQWRKSRGK